jgi:hypothetical protein
MPDWDEGKMLQKGHSLSSACVVNIDEPHLVLAIILCIYLFLFIKAALLP